ncbi:pentapeptide repeat-containing protein [Streptomyces sp. NPDC048845]|uniref:pentapeptide repeat-containing protein n=1 Tax=Streptomyces sp. NPDC048845 TaxID=3155390 RepID=UPI00344967DD
MTAASWPTCTAESDCPGARFGSADHCFAHLAPETRRSVLAPGGDIDVRGVPFRGRLLDELLEGTQGHFGVARFNGARFDGAASFDGARFGGAAFFHGSTFGRDVTFTGARFDGYAGFGRARFRGEARFDRTEFTGRAWFRAASFGGAARFGEAGFGGEARFDGARFHGGAFFSRARFAENSVFGGARFHEDAHFDRTAFHGKWTGPFVCAGRIRLVRATVHSPVRIKIAALGMDARGIRLMETSVFWLRRATVDWADARLSQPVTLATHPVPFTGKLAAPAGDRPVDGPELVRIVDLSGVDASLLVLRDVDLSSCTLVGAYRLDQISLIGRCRFDAPPAGIAVGRAWFPVRRWTRRRVLAEEHHWRAAPTHRPLDRTGWRRHPRYATGEGIAAPADVATAYRKLRKALEDSLDGPGAADFYYGEMEMRRHDGGTPRGERGLLHAYWLVSGYGLRASRALGWLLAAMTTTVLLVVGWGLPDDRPQHPAGRAERTSGQAHPAAAGAEPRLTLPLRERWTAERAERASRLVLNSVVFRSSGQALTTAGTWTEMASRFTEPVLLGLAALAIRGRVKRS